MEVDTFLAQPLFLPLDKKILSLSSVTKIKVKVIGHLAEVLIDCINDLNQVIVSLILPGIWEFMLPIGFALGK